MLFGRLVTFKPERHHRRATTSHCLGQSDAIDDVTRVSTRTGRARGMEIWEWFVDLFGKFLSLELREAVG